MKTVINRWLENRIPRWGLVAALVIATAASIGWMNQRQHQLGGGWIGGGASGIWNALQIPLDPAGKTAALRVKTTTLSDAFAGLFAGLGATALNSDAVGEMEMITKDTARFGTVFYGRANTAANPLQLNSIFVMTGTVKFTDPDSIAVSYTIEVYPASADANADGFPDEGAPDIEIPGLLPIQGLDYAKRVTLR